MRSSCLLALLEGGGIGNRGRGFGLNPSHHPLVFIYRGPLANAGPTSEGRVECCSAKKKRARVGDGFCWFPLSVIIITREAATAGIVDRWCCVEPSCDLGRWNVYSGVAAVYLFFRLWAT